AARCQRSRIEAEVCGHMGLPVALAVGPGPDVVADCGPVGSYQADESGIRSSERVVSAPVDPDREPGETPGPGGREDVVAVEVGGAVERAGGGRAAVCPERR